MRPTSYYEGLFGLPRPSSEDLDPLWHDPRSVWLFPSIGGSCKGVSGSLSRDLGLVSRRLRADSYEDSNGFELGLLKGGSGLI